MIGHIYLCCFFLFVLEKNQLSEAVTSGCKGVGLEGWSEAQVAVDLEGTEFSEHMEVAPMSSDIPSVTGHPSSVPAPTGP